MAGCLRWSASTRSEQAKLVNREGDWNLPGYDTVTTTRTQNGGQGRPYLARHKIVIPSSSESSSDEAKDDMDIDTSFTATEETDNTEEAESLKPAATRVIIEVDGLKEMLYKNYRCWECHGPVEVTLRTTCLATSIMLSCTSSLCGYIYYSSPPAQVTVSAIADSR
jgi:hypothetical protein